MRLSFFVLVSVLAVMLTACSKSVRFDPPPPEGDAYLEGFRYGVILVRTSGRHAHAYVKARTAREREFERGFADGQSVANEIFDIAREQPENGYEWPAVNDYQTPSERAKAAERPPPHESPASGRNP
jgi:hypothetical protein